MIYECPSFVDTHSHDDLALFSDPGRPDKKNQGVGVQVIGNCGITPFPALPDACRQINRFFGAVLGSADRRFPDVGDYKRALGRDDIVILQGYNALRAQCFGSSARALRPDETKAMGRAVADAMAGGADGMSIGLAYLPAVGCDSGELVEIARNTPLLSVHLRNESGGVLESLNEVARAIRGTKCHLHVSHLKISGRAHRHQGESLLTKIAHMHEESGTTFDQYPYAFGCTALSALLPPEFGILAPEDLRRANPGDIESRLEDSAWENYVSMCGWEGLRAVSLEKYPEFNNVALADFGPGRMKTILRLILEEPHPSMLIFSQSDEVIDDLLRLPFGCIGTDGLPAVREHPRLTSTFPEFLRRSRRLGLRPEDAIEKAATLPRRIFNIRPKTGGEIRFNWDTGEILPCGNGAGY